MTMLGVNLASALIDGIREAIGPQAAYYALAAVGLNVQFGYAGLMNFGHIASALVGAYGAAITVDQGGSLWLGILIGVGGVMDGKTARAKLEAGAQLVQVYTGLIYRGPGIVSEAARALVRR